MNIKLISGSYKSIKLFEWNNIPDFSIIYGINGSGKTQLLELINYYYDPESYNKIAKNQQLPSFPELQIENTDYKKEDIVFLKSIFSPSNIPITNFAQIQNLIQQIYEQTVSDKIGNNIQYQEIVRKFQEQNNLDVKSISLNEFTEKIPIDFIMTKEIKFNEKIGNLFYTYHIKTLNEKLKNKTPIEIRDKFGQPPWEILIDIFERINFPYKITTPEKLDLLSAYELKLYDKNDSKIQINFNDLSGGEKVIISLIFWLFNAQEYNILPKLILLDEPDAHLHPTLTKDFLEIINDILVHKYNTRVIMTTHSPSTVAIAPEGSLFEMKKEEPRIEYVTDISHATSLLTSNIITVTPTTKYVLVEDTNDYTFYTNVLETLKLSKIIPSSISIVFIPSSHKEGKEKIPGGKSVVKDWAEKLSNSGLEYLICGLVDRDSATISKDGLLKLNRYSIENYLLDPIIIYGVLLEFEEEPTIDEINLNYGEQYKIGRLDKTSLQKIINEIVHNIETGSGSFNSTDKNKTTIKLINDIELDYPNWLINKNGHELMDIIRLKYGNRIITMKNLINSIRKIQLLPMDLKNLMISIWEK